MCILSTGYLPSNLIPPSQLHEMIPQVKKVIMHTNPDYNLAIKRLHPYYDMEVVTFEIDNNSDLSIQFPAFFQP